MTTSTSVTAPFPDTLRHMFVTLPTQAFSIPSMRALAAPIVGSGAESFKPVKRAVLVDGVQARATANFVGTVRLLGTQTDPDETKTILEDMFDMQSAVLDQSWKLSQDWWKGLQQIFLDWFASREANTLSKAIERDYNVAGQFGTLIADQVTGAVVLIERANVGYGYWLDQKLGQSPS